MNARTNAQRKRNRGHALIELGSVCIFLVVASLLSLDVGVMVWADSACDRACRDCVRAAAQGSDSITALKLAQAALRTHSQGNTFLSNPNLDQSTFVYQDYNGSPPPDQSPYVSCTTSVQVRLPAPVFFSGAVFKANNGGMTFYKTYSFPIVKTQLYLPP